MSNEDRVTAKEIIESGNRVRIVKFGATWCKPCVQIAPVVHELCKTLHPDIQYIPVDIDEDSETYLLLKSKRIVSGIPAIVLYQNGNNRVLNPDNVACGSDVNGIRAVFNRAEQFNTFL